jgi:VWFA-related protein
MTASLLAAAFWMGTTAAAQQQPTFRSSVDLIAVDVQVIDQTGHPVANLDPSQFEVSIDGQRRRVVSAEFIKSTTAATDARVAGDAPLMLTAAPEPDRYDTPGRVFMLAFDVDSFGVGDSRNVVQAAQQFIHELQPNDMVGVYAFPLGPKLAPTTDHALATRRVDLVVGHREPLHGEYNLTPIEIIDIVAETARNASRAVVRPAQEPAVNGVRPPPVAPDDSDTLRRVELRECGTTDTQCAEGIQTEAATSSFLLESQLTDSLNGLRTLVQNLGEYPGRKTVVLFSAGMVVSDRPGGRPDVGDLPKLLGQEAAKANTAIYALHVDSAFWTANAAETRKADRVPEARSRERALLGRVLDQFSGASGGALFPVLMGRGDLQLRRVLTETSASYLLGVEPAAADRDGRLRQLKIKVDKDHVTVRSRSWVMIPKKQS